MRKGGWRGMASDDLGTAGESSGRTPAQAWVDYIAPFAAAIGLTADEVSDRLRPLVGDPGSDAIDALKNEEYTPFSDIQAALAGVPVARLRKAVAENLRGKADAAAAATSPMSNLSLDASLGIL